MISAKPIRDIESKIRELEQKKQELAQQRALELSRIIDACEVDDMDPEVFAGALQYIRTAITLRDAKVDLWRSSGRKVLKTLMQAPESSSVKIKLEPEKPTKTKIRKTEKTVESQGMSVSEHTNDDLRQESIKTTEIPTIIDESLGNEPVVITEMRATTSSAQLLFDTTTETNVSEIPTLEAVEERKVANAKSFNTKSYLDDIYMEKILENWS